MTARITGADPYVKPDERDKAILAERQAAFLADEQIKQGDAVIFADDVRRFVSHVWPAYEHPTDGYPAGIQTSNGYSFYLGDGYVSHSGSLFTPVPLVHFERTIHTTELGVWFFHHDWAQAHHAVHAVIDVPVWRANVPSTDTH